jgi:hypothetical protein
MLDEQKVAVVGNKRLLTTIPQAATSEEEELTKDGGLRDTLGGTVGMTGDFTGMHLSPDFPKVSPLKEEP